MTTKNLLRNIALPIFQIVVLIYTAWLRVDNARIVHEARSFGDEANYKYLASLSVFSREFWSGSKPPLTSLLWKLVDSQPDKIFNAQLYISIICWGILAFTVAAVIRSYLVKPVAFATVLAFSLSRDVFMWDPFLGSESLSLSFTALFIASALWLIQEWRWYKVAVFLLTSFLIVFTRDTNAYLLLMIAAVILPVFWFTEYRWGVALMSGVFVLIYLVSSSLATAGLRPYRAILMITSLRVYPSEEYTSYFREHGMPVDRKLVELSRSSPEDKFLVNKALYYNEDQKTYRQWVLKHGQREYLKFLWFYKADTLQGVFLENPGQSFYPDVYYYTATGYHPIINDARISEILYPTRFGLLFFLVTNIAAAFIAAFAWRDRRALWLVPLLMILFTYPQAVLVWAGDANDIARHSIPHNVLLRLGVWLLLFFVLDYITMEFLPRLTFFKRTTSPVQEQSFLS